VGRQTPTTCSRPVFYLFLATKCRREFNLVIYICVGDPGIHAIEAAVISPWLLPFETI
jgi:hypothetical protein